MMVQSLEFVAEKEDSHGYENRKSWKNILSVEKIDKHNLFAMKIKMINL